MGPFSEIRWCLRILLLGVYKCLIHVFVDSLFARVCLQTTLHKSACMDLYAIELYHKIQYYKRRDFSYPNNISHFRIIWELVTKNQHFIFKKIILNCSFFLFQFVNIFVLAFRFKIFISMN